MAEDLVGAEGGQLLLAGAVVGFEADPSADLLAEPLVGNADDVHLGHGLVAVQHVLHLARVHVLAAADQHVLQQQQQQQQQQRWEVVCFHSSPLQLKSTSIWNAGGPSGVHAPPHSTPPLGGGAADCRETR